MYIGNGVDMEPCRQGTRRVNETKEAKRNYTSSQEAGCDLKIRERDKREGRHEDEEVDLRRRRRERVAVIPVRDYSSPLG